MRFCPNHLLAAFAAGVLVPSAMLRAADAPAAKQAEDPAMAEEVAYINALVGANLPDIATTVIEAAKKKWPVLGPQLKVSEMQGELRMGHFEKVQKEIDALKEKKGPEYWALKLAMADAYYARDKIKECRTLYTEFFGAVKEPGPELKKFYVESGYKWAQMLLNDKKPAEAAKIYGVILKQDINEDAWAAIATDNCELLLKLAQGEKDAAKKEAFLKQATVYVDKLLWKSDMGVVFGRAVSMKAHIEMLRGKVEQAQFLVNDYMPQLKEIDQTLKEQDPKGTKGFLRMSPVPQCRYLLAKLLWEQASEELAKPKFDRALVNDLLLGAKDAKTGKRNGLGAINHSVTVYINYPMSSWAMQAGALVDEIAAQVKAKLGADIKSKFKISPAQMRNVQQMQFRNAGEILRDGDYENAVKAYQDVLRQLPEVPDAVQAVANLAEAYLNLWQRARKGPEKDAYRLDASAVEGYLAERFAGAKKGAYVKEAGDLVLRLATREKELGNADRAQELYDTYFEAYPTHYNAAQMALSLAGLAYKAENFERAAKYYEVVANNYSNSTHHALSLNMLSVCYGKLGDEAKELDWLRAYAAEAKQPLEKIATQLRLAQKQKDSGFAMFEAAETNAEQAVELKNAGTVKVVKAFKDFSLATATATKLIDDKFTSKKDVPKYLDYRETALMLAGESLSRLAWPEAKVSQFRKLAVKTYEQYISLYPKGKYAPQVYVKIGTIWTAEKNGEEAKKAFARLKENFPESEEAKNSTPRLAKTLIEMGLKAEGVEQYGEMLRTSGNYQARQFLEAGEALLSAKSYDTARQAYDKAIELAKSGTNEQVSVIARAVIGQANSYFKEGRFAEAHESLDKFIGDEKFARSPLVVDANFLLIEVASEEGRREKDDTMRMKYFNAAVGAIKKVRNYRKEQAQQDELDLMSGDVLVRKMEAEEAMGSDKAEQAKETCGRAVVTFTAYLMAHEPTPEHPFEKMTAAQQNNLERCYSTALPLMAKLGKSQAEQVIKYGEAYLKYFPDGKHKTAVQNALNQAKAE
ncbi:MAG: tetratricopeptide repeat protein [Kiritimatiellae bacterium]|nr:tetratricopeptide repeat protein [Kiritimatiellia bacterium]